MNMPDEVVKQTTEDALQAEALRSEELAERLSVLEEENARLKEALSAFEGKLSYRAGTPLRNASRYVSKQVTRVKNQGSVGGVILKIREKLAESKAKVRYGTQSFPSDEVRAREAAHVFADPVTFSILTPVYNTQERFLRDMVESVLMQTYQHWQLILADASDAEHAYVGEIVRDYIEKEKALRDGASRIVYTKLKENGGISRNTNTALKHATGLYLCLLDHDDILHPEVLYLYALEIERSGADYLYSDEATFSGNSVDHIITMHFKPDFAPDTLRANNYICHFSALKKTLLEGEPIFRHRFDGSQDHDMILRVTDRAEKIVHIPRILYYWRSHALSTASGIEAKTYAIDAAKGAVSEHLARHGFRHFRITSTKAFETIFKISYEIMGLPQISIVIPSKDRAEDLKRLVDSILEKSTWRNYDITVVENGSVEDKTVTLYALFREEPYAEKVRVVTFPKEEGKEEGFDFSAVVNYGVAQTRGDYVLLLNNDTEVVTPNWMEEMLMYAQRDDVGAVGAKLLFPDGRVQHAGVVIGLGAHRTAGHPHYGKPSQNFGYMGRLSYAQNVSAVTGACLMVARKKYDEAGGFDSLFAVALNDVDFCLRLREKGYLNVFTPFAVLTHYESLSRGSDTEGENERRYEREAAIFRTRWNKLLEEGDPYYNINFTLDKADYSIRMTADKQQTEDKQDE